MNPRNFPKKNRFLNSLPSSSYNFIEKYLVACHLLRDSDLFQSSKKIDHIYFPTNSIVAVMNYLENGANPEVATIGNDGLVGIDAMIGHFPSARKHIVQSAGYAYKIKADIIKKLFNEDVDFRNRLLKYNSILFTQAAQLVVCNRFHTIEQQICRFLLTSIDRWDSQRISLTHQRIADLLGVRRPSVSEVSAKLASLGLIHYHRGCVTILNQPGLHAHTCECYLVVKNEVNSILNN